MLAFSLVVLGATFFSWGFTDVHADEISSPQFEESFYRAEIIAIDGPLSDSIVDVNVQSPDQTLQLRLLEGPDEGAALQVPYGAPPGVGEPAFLEVGDRVVVVKTTYDGESSYRFFERYRLNSLWILLAIFVVVTVAVSGRKGISSLLGLAFTLLVLVLWVVPKIVAGANPVLVSFIGAVVIASCSLFIAHGFHRRTLLSVVSTLMTLVLAFAFAFFAVSLSHLFGLGSDAAVDITMSNLSTIDLRGLLLGAIVIGVLGVLDDVTTTQTATVEELHKADPRFGFVELYRRASEVGKEHIVSLVNTLVIAYAGASFPIFLFIVTATQPLWVILNNEFMAEEIVRSLVGSTTLIFAVPISTALAAWIYGKGKGREEREEREERKGR